MTLIYTHPSGYRHVAPPLHPEQVARLDAVAQALDGLALDWREAPEAGDADILRCHPQSFLSMLRLQTPSQGWTMLDADTVWLPAA